MAPDRGTAIAGPNKRAGSTAEWREASLGDRFVVYTGTSMHPTLQEPEVIELLPYQGRIVQVGDVVLFLPPGQDQRIVHRVVEVTAEGIRTRGDNSTGTDTWVLQPADIASQVVAAWRGTRQRRILGGQAGQLLALWLRLRRVVSRNVTRWLRAPYHVLSRGAVIARLLPKRLEPRVVAFQAQGCNQWRLLMGNRVVGWYDGALDRWIIPHPYRLFVDEEALRRIKPSPSQASSPGSNS